LTFGNFGQENFMTFSKERHKLKGYGFKKCI
jgi:hypothetical protein